MWRKVRAVALGVGCGALICLSGPVLLMLSQINSSDPPISIVTPEDQLHLGIVTALGAVNGGIGAGIAMLRRGRGIWPVFVIPLLLLYLPIIDVLQGADGKTWVPELIIVLFVGVLVWVAGRVGQEFGIKVTD